MSASDEAQAARYRVVAKAIQVRISNTNPTVTRGPWISVTMYQNNLLDASQVHPDDLTHLLTGLTPGLPRFGGGQPMIELAG